MSQFDKFLKDVKTMLDVKLIIQATIFQKSDGAIGYIIVISTVARKIPNISMQFWGAKYKVDKSS